MSEHDIILPAAALARAKSAGAPGAAWVSALPGLVADLARDWSLTLGPAMDGGSEAFVARARTAEGQAAVLKLIPPYRDPSVREAETLLAADGRGYVQVLAHDRRRRALLLERLGGRLAETGWPVDRQIAALCETLAAA
ncbi:MAG: aminoglycoside phosphotransferase family protein, partial [Phenylobacterium sp.]